nr:hypothetical protein [uncultured Cupriavidus sp.]
MSCLIWVEWKDEVWPRTVHGAGAQCAEEQAAGVVPLPPPVVGGVVLLSSPPQALNNRARQSTPAPRAGLPSP